MEKVLEHIWSERLFNQKFDLIGGNRKGEGNGYNDQIVFSPPRHIHVAKSEDSLNSSVYFRDLCNRIDPSLTLNRNRTDPFFDLENCSDNYRQTFIKYFGSLEEWGRERALDELRIWTQRLVYHGRIYIEFVSWFDNKSDNFYAFELKIIHCALHNEKSDSYIFSEPVIDNNGKVLTAIKREIPKEKCIVIEWPKELGGFGTYKKKKRQIEELGDKFDIQDSFFNPGGTLSKWKSHDLRFNQIVSDWGLFLMQTEELSYYYRYYHDFKLKKTAILCVDELIVGVKQVVTILNERLDEEANVVFSNPAYSKARCEELLKKFNEGKLSFKDSLQYLYKES